jgi:hypothetical protein
MILASYNYWLHINFDKEQHMLNYKEDACQ